MAQKIITKDTILIQTISETKWFIEDANTNEWLKNTLHLQPTVHTFGKGWDKPQLNIEEYWTTNPLEAFAFFKDRDDCEQYIKDILSKSPIRLEFIDRKLIATEHEFIDKKEHKTIEADGGIMWVDDSKGVRNGYYAATTIDIIGVPKIELEDEVWEMFKKVDGTCKKGEYEHWLFESGYKSNQAKYTTEHLNAVRLWCSGDEHTECKTLDELEAKFNTIKSITVDTNFKVLSYE